MRKFLTVGLTCLALSAAGWLFYARPFSHPAPAPKDLTLILPRQLLEKATPAQIAVLKGDAVSAPTEKTGNAGAGRFAGDAPASRPITGLEVTLTREAPGPLKGKAVNTTGEIVRYEYAAGTLFSNGVGDVVLLKKVSVEVPPRYASDFELPVAATSSAHGALEGAFTPRDGTVNGLDSLLSLIKVIQRPSPGAMQTAVLAITEDVPLDVVAEFPRLRPQALVSSDDMPFRVPTQDLIEALGLLKQAGTNINNLGMTGEPQLRVMSVLDPRSHAAAMQLFDIADKDGWDFWKHQLLEGDPSLRHYALYGIARYYPEVAVHMLPDWVRSKTAYRGDRISAAWALALIDDARAQKALTALRQEMKDDPNLRQTIDRALRHRDSGDGRVASAN